MLLRRRSAAIAAGGLLALAVIALVVGGGSSDSDESAEQPLPALQGTVKAKRVGVAVKRPAGWVASRQARGVRLRSADGNASLSISAPPGARSRRRVLRSAVSAIRSNYKAVEVAPTSGRSIAGRPATSAVVSAVNRRGTPLRILVVGVSGRKRAYLVELFTARGAPAGRLTEAQLALNTLRLSR